MIHLPSEARQRQRIQEIRAHLSAATAALAAVPGDTAMRALREIRSALALMRWIRRLPSGNDIRRTSEGSGNVHER